MRRNLMVVCLMACWSLNAFSEALVVDESENYAFLEEQPEAYTPPVASDNNASSEETALAKDDQENTTGNNIDLLNKIQGLQQAVQELRGQLDEQAHAINALKEQQQLFYNDLDARIQPSSNPTAPNAAPSTPPISEATVEAPKPRPITTTPIAQSASTPTVHDVNPANEQIRYLAAYELIKQKRFDEGLHAMQSFVEQYPHGGYTANAEYWLGELHLKKAHYSEAISHFNVVLEHFPSSSKSAPSLLKIGYALADSGKSSEARVTLQSVVQRYPDTDAARLASTKLKALNTP